LTEAKPAGAGVEGTRVRALDAAEKLFIELGYEGTSIRAIAQAAQANLGSLVYHFATKERLLHEVCERRFAGVQARQAAALRACLARLDAGEAVPLAEAVEAMVAPPLLAHQDEPEQQRRLRQLYGRVLTEPSQTVLDTALVMFAETTNLFRTILRRLLGHLDEDEFYWRYTCAIGAFILAQSFGDRVAYATGRPVPDDDPQEVVRKIVGFMVRGLEG